MPMPSDSYYDHNARQGAALLRARQPYLIKNIFTGLALATFTIGVYAFTIKAVAQDDFSDVPMPDAPAQAAHTPNVGVGKVADAEAVKK